jgi:hypothetical protein
MNPTIPVFIRRMLGEPPIWQGYLPALPRVGDHIALGSTVYVVAAIRWSLPTQLADTWEQRVIKAQSGAEVEDHTEITVIVRLGR